MSDEIFYVEHLTVNYDKTAVLWDVSCSVPKGKLIGIIGPNGAGKSTLLKAALRLVKPLSGKIKLDGKSAYVPQRSSVDWDFPITVFDVVLMGVYGKLGFFKWAKKAHKEATRRALEKVGMLGFANRQISQLSSGQQQRVFIARALLQDADIYLLDEPFAGVDMATEKEIMTLLRKLKKEGKTIFVVHHDLTCVESYFDWVIMLNTCLIASGPVKEVFHSDNLMRTYGRSALLLDEAAKLSQSKASGVK